MRAPRAAVAATVALALLATACGSAGDADDPQAAQEAAQQQAAAPSDAETAVAAGSLDGVGATFPTPLFQDWIFEYEAEVNPDASINYQLIGSGGGIEQFLSQTVDFGSSER